MKQSFDGLSSLRLLSRKLGISLAAAVAIAAAACGGNNNNTCPNLPIANGLLGQTTYILGTGNGVSSTGGATRGVASDFLRSGTRLGRGRGSGLLVIGIGVGGRRLALSHAAKSSCSFSTCRGSIGPETSGRS